LTPSPPHTTGRCQSTADQTPDLLARSALTLSSDCPPGQTLRLRERRNSGSLEPCTEPSARLWEPCAEDRTLSSLKIFARWRELVTQSACSPMQPALDYILRNKEWIFSGIGVLAVSAVFWLLRRLLTRKSQPTTQTDKKLGSSTAATGSVPPHWYGVMPPQSKYEFVPETATSIPLGLQSFSFEYGPHGHAHPLTLKGSMVRMDIQFTCRVTSPYKAVFAAGEYALNILKPKFLTLARTILEQHSLARLRSSRLEVAKEIVAELGLQFEDLGFRLESVTIGAIDKLNQGSG